MKIKEGDMVWVHDYPDSNATPEWRKEFTKQMHKVLEVIAVNVGITKYVPYWMVKVEGSSRWYRLQDVSHG